MSDIPLTKVPPHSIEAEKATLGSLLIDQDAIIKIADFLKPEDFYYENHRTIYQAMLDLFTKHLPLDLKIITTYLEDHGKLDQIGGTSYLVELTIELPTATHVVKYAFIVKQKSTLRKLIQSGEKISSLGYNETADIEALLEEAEKTLFSTSQTFVKDRFVHIKDILNLTYEKITELHDPEMKEKYRGVPTGFRSLDHILSGLHPTDLVVIAARPAMGKTALVLNMALNVARRKKSVGVISLEMSKEQLVERLFSALLGVDSWRMKTGRLTDEDFTRIGAVMDDLTQSNMFIDDSSGSSIIEIRTKVRRLKAEHGLDLLIVDYLQMMSVGRPTYQSNRVQEISEITRALKNLARELRIPVIALSQLSRAVENRPSKIPQLSDLRESGCLAGDTLITRADTGQLIPIKELVGQTNIPVFSLNNAYKLEIRHISKVFSSGKKQIYELKTRSGRAIKASGNHPFLTIGGWQPLETLLPKLHIAIPRNLPLHFDQTQKQNPLSDNEITPNTNVDIIPRQAWKISIEPEKERMGISWRTFSKKIDTSYCGTTLFRAGLSRDRMTKVAEALKSKILQALAQSDVYWDEVISVTPLGIEEVFDATVPGTHNFLANDFIVHNSIEQDSDVVLMMYREDYYEEDTDRKGITDIFIRKHRNGPTGHIELMFEKEKMRFLDIERQRTLA